MKLTGDFKYQGSERRTGIKDPTKVYFEVALLSGIEQLRCTCEQNFFDKVLPTVKPFTDCKCTFTLNDFCGIFHDRTCHKSCSDRCTDHDRSYCCQVWYGTL